MTVFSQLPPQKARLFALQASGVNNTGPFSAGFETDLARLLEVRTAALDPHLEHMRTSARDMLRIGHFKPTGRSKPASEYLYNAALTGAFPRISPLVDICNYISLKYLVPVSLWDLNLAGCDTFLFRPGVQGEAYVFNSGGQLLELEDLMCGFGVNDGIQTPFVTPVKDAQATKTTSATQHIGAVLYWPASYAGQLFNPPQIVAEFCEILTAVCGGHAEPVETLSAQ